jgi:hypothetical protein
MFVKRARPRPATRTRDVEDDAPSLAASSPAAKPDEEEEEAGNVMARKKAQKKKLAKGSRLSFGGDDEVSNHAPSRHH